MPSIILVPDANALPPTPPPLVEVIEISFGAQFIQMSSVQFSPHLSAFPVSSKDFAVSCDEGKG